MLFADAIINSTNLNTLFPTGMAIAFLNDPERQHALAHLRKQMMLSNPQECMLCQSYFDSSADIRCCPWCVHTFDVTFFTPMLIVDYLLLRQIF